MSTKLLAVVEQLLLFRQLKLLSAIFKHSYKLSAEESLESIIEFDGAIYLYISIEPAIGVAITGTPSNKLSTITVGRPSKSEGDRYKLLCLNTGTKLITFPSKVMLFSKLFSLICSCKV